MNIVQFIDKQEEPCFLSEWDGNFKPDIISHIQ